MSEEEILREIAEAGKLARQSQTDIDKMSASLIEQALKLVSDIYYHDLLTMESSGFREIQNVLSQRLTSLAIGIDDIVFNNQIQ